jgi:hypothetical protein
MMNIIKVSGFHILSKGDPTVGINDASWELQDDFYFDNQEELEVFRKDIKVFFENYCGEVTVKTFEEVNKLIDEEERIYYKIQYPVRYLIRDKNIPDLYKQANYCASYSSDVGTAIHAELPDWLSDDENEIIKSTDPEYKKILLKTADKLEKEIGDEEYRLNIAKHNLSLIKKELKYIK